MKSPLLTSLFSQNSWKLTLSLFAFSGSGHLIFVGGGGGGGGGEGEGEKNSCRRTIGEQNSSVRTHGKKIMQVPSALEICITGLLKRKISHF